MNRFMIYGLAAISAMTLALGWTTKHYYDLASARKFEITQRDTEIAALKEAARLDEQEAVAGYEAASSACRQAIRAAVNAVRLPKIEVPRYEANGDPNPACPAISLQSIQNANGNNEVPARDQSGNSTGTESPR